MGPSSKFQSQFTRSKPISVIEFANALLTTWQAAGSNQKRVTTFGLAVSGGVDSMTLAALCSKLQDFPYFELRTLLQAGYNQNASGSPLSREIKFQAFVVDHGIRKGSDLEAEAVSKVLEARHIPTKLLKIDWAGHERPAELPNFESLARKYRFQALGKACRDQGIISLLLAHHEDDQVETLIMRLLTGHRMAGLRGMQPVATIPQCYGLYGVHESGGIKHQTRDIPSSTAPTPSLRAMKPLETEYGGVKVYRPLLQFSKDRLIATCQAERMGWFEDHTNKDPTVTMRNAIRHMYKNHSLPTALSKAALLDLSTKAQADREAVHKVAKSSLSQCSIEFESRTGVLKAHFADLSHINLDQLEVDGRLSAAHLLRRIVELVSPQERTELSSLVRAVERIFPECFSDRGSPPPTTAFTAASVNFKVTRPEIQQDGGLGISGKPTWLMSRQSFKSTAVLPTIQIPENPDCSTNSQWSEWTLFDGRFWIRVQNLAAASIIIRPFREGDLAKFKKSLSKQDWNILRQLLWKLAPGHVRWTLPAIALRNRDGNERVLALPTLDIGVIHVEKMVNWEARYKMVGVENSTACDV